MGEERLQALIQESLSVATRTKAIKPSELSRVIVDTTVQPKNVTFPTDAKLLNRAREKLVRLARLTGIGLRQSYARVGKFALIQHQRYAHAKQFKRAKKMLRKLRTYLGRVIRDIGRKIENNDALEAKFAKLLLLARRVREQKQHQRGPRVYSLHAPEVECIGKGKAHRPVERWGKLAFDEFGADVDVEDIGRVRHGEHIELVAHDKRRHVDLFVDGGILESSSAGARSRQSIPFRTCSSPAGCCRRRRSRYRQPGRTMPRQGQAPQATRAHSCMMDKSWRLAPAHGKPPPTSHGCTPAACNPVVISLPFSRLATA
jgi:hypothetical protein